MGRRARIDHVVLDPDLPPTQIGGVCTRCGGKMRLELPQGMGVVGRVMEDFAKAHRHCQVPASPSEFHERGKDITGCDI